ncbi:hypothetical protein RUND412_005624 [Rhizina undulata]
MQIYVSSADHRAEAIRYVILFTIHDFDLDSMEQQLLFGLAIHTIYNMIEYTIENHTSPEMRSKLSLDLVSRQNLVESIRSLASIYFVGTWSGCIMMIAWERCKCLIRTNAVEDKLKGFRAAPIGDIKECEQCALALEKELARAPLRARDTVGDYEIARDEVEKSLDDSEDETESVSAAESSEHLEEARSK